MFSCEIIKEIKDLLTKNYEVYGNFKISNNFEYSPIILGQGSPKKEGQRLKIYTPHKGASFWHTHPYCTYPYPSVEDIIHILEESKSIESIIFTKYGYWRMFCTKKINMRENEKKHVQRCFDYVFYNTHKKLKEDKLIPEELIDCGRRLEQCINKMNTNFCTCFILWKNEEEK